MIIGGSEDGNVYAWEREPTSIAAPAAEISALSGSVNGSSGPQYGQTSRTRQTSAQAPAGHNTHSAGSGVAAVNVSPHTVLEAEQGHGAVFDVKERAGMMVCAWNDGHVGCWEDETDG